MNRADLTFGGIGLITLVAAALIWVYQQPLPERVVTLPKWGEGITETETLMALMATALPQHVAATSQRHGVLVTVRPCERCEDVERGLVEMARARGLDIQSAIVVTWDSLAANVRLAVESRCAIVQRGIGALWEVSGTETSREVPASFSGEPACERERQARDAATAARLLMDASLPGLPVLISADSMWSVVQ